MDGNHDCDYFHHGDHCGSDLCGDCERWKGAFGVGNRRRRIGDVVGDSDGDEGPGKFQVSAARQRSFDGSGAESLLAHVDAVHFSNYQRHRRSDWRKIETSIVTECVSPTVRATLLKQPLLTRGLLTQIKKASAE